MLKVSLRSNEKPADLGSGKFASAFDKKSDMLFGSDLIIHALKVAPIATAIYDNAMLLKCIRMEKKSRHGSKRKDSSVNDQCYGFFFRNQ